MLTLSWMSIFHFVSFSLSFTEQQQQGLSEAFVVGSNTLTAFSLTKPVGSTCLGTFLRVLQSAVGDRLQDWGSHGCIHLVSFCLARDIFSPGEDGPWKGFVWPTLISTASASILEKHVHPDSLSCCFLVLVSWIKTCVVLESEPWLMLRRNIRVSFMHCRQAAKSVTVQEHPQRNHFFTTAEVKYNHAILICMAVQWVYLNHFPLVELEWDVNRKDTAWLRFLHDCVQ